MTLRTLSYGNDGTFLTMGNAAFASSTVVYNVSHWAQDDHIYEYFPEAQTYSRGLGFNNYRYYVGGSFSISIVYRAPEPYSI